MHFTVHSFFICLNYKKGCKFAPSLEEKEQISALTDEFFAFRGEEVHNRDMGYFYIINFNGNSSVNDVIENNPKYVEAQLQKTPMP